MLCSENCKIYYVKQKALLFFRIDQRSLCTQIHLISCKNREQIRTRKKFESTPMRAATPKRETARGTLAGRYEGREFSPRGWLRARRRRAARRGFAFHERAFWPFTIGPTQRGRREEGARATVHGAASAGHPAVRLGERASVGDRVDRSSGLGICTRTTTPRTRPPRRRTARSNAAQPICQRFASHGATRVSTYES